MGLFKKKEEKKASQYSKEDSQVPQLPELPKLPEFPGMNENDNSEITQNDFSLPQLPAYPNSSLGDKFSQNTIKEAVSGGKEVEEGNAEDFELDDEDEEKYPMMQPPSPKSMSKKNAIQNYAPRQYTTSKNPEPVFIRLDKFEESLDIFENAKEQISDIEHLLKEIKDLKQKEDEELNSWENQIQEIKKQIEKVDQDIFSKI